MKTADKRCSKCSSSFPATSEFFYARNYRGKRLLQAWCKGCNTEYQRTPEQKEKRATYMKKYPNRMKDWRKVNPVRAAWLALSERVQRAGRVSFLLTWERFQELMLVKACPICGVTMKDKGNHNRQDPAMKTVDRLLPGTDYTDENCACVCWRCNAIKNEGTAEEHEAIARWMRAQQRLRKVAA